MNDLFNHELYNVVLDVYHNLLNGFLRRGGTFDEMPKYSYRFLKGDDAETTSQREKVLKAALETGFKSEVEKAVWGYLANIHGLDLNSSVCYLVEDFLAYVVPRTIGLSDADDYFNKYYREFDSNIFGKFFTMTVFAIVQNMWDHSSSVMLPPGARFHWAAKDTIRDDRFSRERVVPFLEIKNTAHPIGFGRDIKDQGAYFLFQYTTKLPKNDVSLDAAYRMRDDVVRKFIFAGRLLTYSAVYADYRGFRMPGHLASHSFNCMNFPDERISHGHGAEISQTQSFALSRLLSKLTAEPFANVEVIDHKIDDALRRHRSATLDDSAAKLRASIDQLLDYFQVLESVIPVEGSQNIALYAASLLRASGHSAAPGKALETFVFLKDMHKIRNDIVHGRINQVLKGKAGQKLNIQAFRHAIHTLGALYVMNGPLREHATKLLLGESVKLNGIYAADQAEFVEESKRASDQKNSEFFW